MIVLLLLGVIWAAVLVPPWLQNRRERRPIASIRSFHRQLWLLERASPGHGSIPTGRYSSVTVYGGDAYDPAGYDDYGGYVDPTDDAYGYGDDELDEPGHGYDRRPARAGVTYAGARWVVGGPASGYRTAVNGDRAAASVVDDRWAELTEARRRAAVARSPADVHRRLQGYRRRRRVLATLLVAAVVTALPAALLGGVGWWVGHAVADVLLVSYVALLVQRQRRTIEREAKVHYLAPIRAPRPPVVVLGGGAAR